MAMLSLPYTQRAIVKPVVPDVSRPIRSRPVVVFNMAFKDWESDSRPNFVPAAALSLAGVIRERKLATPVFMRAPFIQAGQLDLPPDISRERPLVFALSLYDDLFRETQDEILRIRQLFPRSIIVLGGPGVNTAKDLRQLKVFFPEADALIKGDGEKAFCQLLSSLKDGRIDLEKLAASGVGGIYATADGREYVDDRTNVLSTEELNALPPLTAFPDLVADIKKNGRLAVHTSRGCKYRCVFCSHKYHDRPIYWSAERILQEIKLIKRRIERGELPKEARRIAFSDDDFFQDKARAVRFLSLVAADPAIRNYFRFSFQAAVGSFLSRGQVDTDLIAQLRRIKTALMNFGTDGFSDKMLRWFGKSGYSWRQAEALMAALNEAGIRQSHYVILTHPQMDLPAFIEQMKNVIAAICSSRSLAVEINCVLTAMEGTILMEKAKEYIPHQLDILAGFDDERKYLPIKLPLAGDPDLVLEIIEALRQPLATVKALERERRELLKKGYAWRGLAETLAFMIRWRRRQPDNYQVAEALRSSNRFVVFYALSFIVEEVERQMAKLEKTT